MTLYELRLWRDLALEKLALAFAPLRAHPWMTGLVLLVVLIVTLVVLAVRHVTTLSQAPVFLRAGAEGYVDVVVPPGASARTVAQLVAEKMETTQEAVLSALRRNQGAIHAGRYRFGNNETLNTIASRLTSGAVEQGTLRIADGMTIWQLRSALAAEADLMNRTGSMSEAELLQAIGATETSLEGLFAPETYKFNSGTSDLVVLKMAYQRQKRLMETLWSQRDPELRLKTPYEALILASIIEKETSHPEDRSLVSSVFHNRLRIRMPLQTDPTIIYGLGESFDGNIRRSDLQRPGPYNTYRNYGLPPTPIAMPSRASIEAALHPAKTKYLYFVARGDGTTQFSTHLDSHNRAVNKFQRGGR